MTRSTDDLARLAAVIESRKPVNGGDPEKSYVARLLHKGPEGHSECGLWVCTPGKWECHVTRDEFCHFLEGHSTYVHESGDVIEITPDTAAFFPKDWKGVCTVHETIKKVYMIR